MAFLKRAVVLREDLHPGENEFQNKSHELDNCGQVIACQSLMEREDRINKDVKLATDELGTGVSTLKASELGLNDLFDFGFQHN